MRRRCQCRSCLSCTDLPYLVELAHCLLADAEAGKDPPQQILVAEFAADLIQRPLRGPQFLGHEFSGVRFVQRALDEIGGEFTNEDLLGRIFSSFCIGK